jgi:hypothetical protein
MPYNRRILDDELDLLFADLPALSIEGPKAVGKTRPRGNERRLSSGSMMPLNANW